MDLPSAPWAKPAEALGDERSENNRQGGKPDRERLNSRCSELVPKLRTSRVESKAGPGGPSGCPKGMPMFHLCL